MEIKKWIPLSFLEIDFRKFEIDFKETDEAGSNEANSSKSS